MLLEGMFLPLTTPFYPDGRLYLRKLEHNVDRYSRTPAAGMVALGTREADGLTDEEARDALNSAIALAAKEKVMLAQVSRSSVFSTLVLARAAAQAGYDAVAVRLPEGLGDAEQKTYLGAVADGCELPLVAVSDGERKLEVDLVKSLAGHPNVIGLMEGDATRVAALREATAEASRSVTVTSVFAAVTGRMLRAGAPQAETGGGTFVSAESLGGGGTALATAPPVAALKTRQKRVGFSILLTRSESMLAGWKAGANGAAPAAAAATPQGCCEVWQAFRDGDEALAEEKQARLAGFAGWAEGSRGTAAVKHGCDWNGYFGGRPRLPLLGLTAEEKLAVEVTLRGLRN